jgi:hypothetical protein
MNINIKDLHKHHQSVQQLISQMVLARTHNKNRLSIPEADFTDEMKDWLTDNKVDYSFNDRTFEFEINLKNNE